MCYGRWTTETPKHTWLSLSISLSFLGCIWFFSRVMCAWVAQLALHIVHRTLRLHCVLNGSFNSSFRLFFLLFASFSLFSNANVTCLQNYTHYGRSGKHVQLDSTSHNRQTIQMKCFAFVFISYLFFFRSKLKCQLAYVKNVCYKIVGNPWTYKLFSLVYFCRN